VPREHREPLVDEHVEPRQDAVGRDDRLRQTDVGPGPVSGRAAGGAGVRDDRGLEELSAGRRREAHPEIADLPGAAAVRMHAVSQDDQVALRRRVDPHRGAGEAEMADGALGEEWRDRARV
jgi:hypothetical protein